MKKFTKATIIALLLTGSAFAQTQNQQTKTVDKELDKNQPQTKATSAHGDPVHGVDVKPAIKIQNKETQTTSSQSINATSYDIKTIKKM